MSNDVIQKLKLYPEQAEKLRMQDETSPSKFSDPSTGMLASLVESKYATAHRQKVGMQDAKVGMYV